MVSTDDLKEEILSLLKEKYKGEEDKFWIYNDFKTIIDNNDLEQRLIFANIETAKRNYINKHGIDHGLRTAINVFNLFHLLEEDIIQSDYIADFLIQDAECTKEHILFILLMASYVHDIGRFFDREINHEEQITEALEIIKKLKQANYICGNIIPNISEYIIPRIKELCLCHDKKDEISGKVEIALIKLADALDCDKNRVYSEMEKKEFKDISHDEKMKKILLNDKYPEKYFGSLNIEYIDINFNDIENVIEIEISIKNYAASVPIKRIINTLKKFETSADSVKELSRNIRVYIKEKENDGHQFLLYPMEFISTPGAFILSNTFDINILNKNGDAEINNILEIKNNEIKSGMTKHPFKMGGTYPSKWEEDISAEMLEFNNSKIEFIYKGVEEDLKFHKWMQIFRKIPIGDSIKILSKFKWKKFFNVQNDVFEFKASTPHKLYEVNIFFPEEIKKENIKSYFEIIDPNNDIIYKNIIIPSYSETMKKEFINFKIDSLKLNWRSNIIWSIDNQ